MTHFGMLGGNHSPLKQIASVYSPRSLNLRLHLKVIVLPPDLLFTRPLRMVGILQRWKLAVSWCRVRSERTVKESVTVSVALIFHSDELLRRVARCGTTRATTRRRLLCGLAHTCRATLKKKRPHILETLHKQGTTDITSIFSSLTAQKLL